MDPVLAVHYFKLSADQGHAEGEYNYGLSLEQGAVIPSSVERIGQNCFRHCKSLVSIVLTADSKLSAEDLQSIPTWLRICSRCAVTYH
jgi:TPR repeat protein